MSEASSHHREWKCYAGDMIEFAEKVLAYTSGFDQETLLDDDLVYDATLRNIQLIGQAANHVPSDVREAHPEIPWHAIIGTRNRLAHTYLSISDSVIWSIIEDAIPALLPQLRSLLAVYETDHDSHSRE